jgi:hypothetical protein
MPSTDDTSPSQEQQAAQNPQRELPAAGPFGEALLQRLKTAPQGTPDGSLVMDMLRSTPVEQLKAAQAQASPKERGLLFSVIPGDQITSIWGIHLTGVELVAASGVRRFSMGGSLLDGPG